MREPNAAALLIAQKRAEVVVRHPPLARALAPVRFAPTPAVVDRTAITLGAEFHNGAPVTLPAKARLEHMHVIGTTGAGKTNLLAHMMQETIKRGHGVCFFDPHGNHPDSSYRVLLSWLDSYGYLASGKVHVLDPNAPSHVVGFNPLASLSDDTDLSVLADAVLEAVERVWNEDMHGKPTTRTILKATFIALAELGLTLAEAKLLYDPADRDGVRRWALDRLKNDYARGEFERLHRMAPRDFHAEVVGPSNRLNDFLSSDAIRIMLGQTARVLDLRRILDDGHILLVNLQDGRRMSGANARLLGAILLRYLFFFASRRANTRRPYFLVIDECQRFLSGDIPTLLAEARKFGIGVTLAHQYLAQLGEPGDPVREAVLNCTNVKAVFRVKDPKEAQHLAETVVPLDLETPVSILTKPAAVGQEIVRLRGWSQGRNSSEVATATTSEGVADMSGQSESVGAGVFNAAGLTDVFDAGGGGMTAMPAALTQALANSSGASEMRGAATTRATTHSVAKSHGKAVSEGVSQSESAAETFKTVYKDMPGAVHSLDNLRYRAAEAIRRLPAGAMFCAWGGRAAHVKTPLVRDAALPGPDMSALIARVLAASEYATPAAAAIAAVEARRARLMASPVSPPGEPDFLEREPLSSPLDDEWVAGFWDRLEERAASERAAAQSANDNDPAVRR